MASGDQDNNDMMDISVDSLLEYDVLDQDLEEEILRWEPEETGSASVSAGGATGESTSKEAISSSTSSSSPSASHPVPPHTSNSGSSPPTVQEMPSSTMEEHRRPGRPRYMDKNLNCSRRCQICNDMASGFHYGVWSCEGCKAFFKRSLQGTPVDYVCPATNSCTIDKHRRKSCQACRLRKCIEMGMNRGKKGPRGPRGPNKRKLMEAGQPPYVPSGPESSEPRIKIKKEIVDIPDPTPAPAPPAPVTKSEDIHPLAEYMLKIDPPTRQSKHDPTLPDTEVSVMSSIMKLADTELVDIINWAKTIPGYTDLQLRDRIHLLEASWMEILMMGLLWRSHTHSADGVLVFAPDLRIDKQRAQIASITSITEKMLGLANKFSSLQINKEEFVLLRALLLFNAEIADLPSVGKIESLREKLVDALQYTCCQRLHRGPERVAHLLLFLPHIRQCSLATISRMFTLGKEHAADIPTLELLQEMIEARSPIAMPPVMCRHLMDTEKSKHSPPHHQQQHNRSPAHHPNIPASPPVAMGAPAQYNPVSTHVNLPHTAASSSSSSASSSSSYHSTSSSSRHNSHQHSHHHHHHHQLPQHLPSPPVTQHQQQHLMSVPVPRLSPHIVSQHHSHLLSTQQQQQQHSPPSHRYPPIPASSLAYPPVTSYAPTSSHK